MNGAELLNLTPTGVDCPKCGAGCGELYHVHYQINPRVEIMFYRCPVCVFNWGKAANRND